MISEILHYLAGGALALVAASLAMHFGWRSADRLPGESRWPTCVYCLKPFRWQDVCPLFGWMLRSDTLNLPCPCGQRKELWALPLAEFLGFFLGMGAIYLVGWHPMFIPLCIALGLLVAIALIDFHFGIIPDGLNLLIAVMGIAWVFMSGGNIYIALMMVAALLALGLFCALVYSRWRGREMLGLGDVKFFAAAGFWLQPEMAPWFLAMAGFIGATIGIINKRITGSEESPFAPSLCAALVICVLYQISQMP
ncbi:MAG: A24 family peptidase [Alphaproteobacteria bacterium]